MNDNKAIFSSQRYAELLDRANDRNIAKTKWELIFAERCFYEQNTPPHSTVLVAGSGLGHDAFYYRFMGHDVTGIEIDPYLLSISKQRREKFSPDIKDKVKFYQADFCDLDPKEWRDEGWSVATLNMGTLNNFDDLNKPLQGLARVSERFFATIYIPGQASLEYRMKMYEEEALVNPRIANETIVSDDGHYSRSIYPCELVQPVTRLGKHIRFHSLTPFAMMAEIS